MKNFIVKINFIRIYEFIFKSFDVSSDTRMIKKIEAEGQKYAMIVKRDWIYALLISWWRMPAVLLIALANCILLYLNLGASVFTWIAIWLISYNTLSWVLASISYIVKYKKLYKGWFKIKDVYTLKNQLQESDEVYTHFFNLTNFNIIFFFVLSIFLTFHIITNFSNLESTGYAILDIILYIIQIWFYFNYLKKITDLEMDFNIIFPWKIVFNNQSLFYSAWMSLESSKIKSINYKFAWFLGSFLKFWDVLILAEWDLNANWQMNMNYIHAPDQAYAEIDKLVKGQINIIKEKDNVYLKYLLDRAQIDIEFTGDLSLTEEELKRLNEFVKQNDAEIKKDFEKWDEDLKNEIKEIYKNILKLS